MTNTRKMTTERMEVERMIPADAYDPPRAAERSPGPRHHSSGTPTSSPASRARFGDKFVVHMAARLNDFPMGHYDVTVLTTFDRDRSVDRRRRDQSP